MLPIAFGIHTLQWRKPASPAQPEPARRQRGPRYPQKQPWKLAEPCRPSLSVVEGNGRGGGHARTFREHGPRVRFIDASGACVATRARLRHLLILRRKVRRSIGRNHPL